MWEWPSHDRNIVKQRRFKRWFQCNAGIFLDHTVQTETHQKLEDGHLQCEPLGGAAVVKLRLRSDGGVASRERTQKKRWKD